MLVQNDMTDAERGVVANLIDACPSDSRARVQAQIDASRPDVEARQAALRAGETYPDPVEPTDSAPPLDAEAIYLAIARHIRGRVLAPIPSADVVIRYEMTPEERRVVAVLLGESTPESRARVAVILDAARADIEGWEATRRVNLAALATA
jgi:hypothetical protein